MTWSGNERAIPAEAVQANLEMRLLEHSNDELLAAFFSVASVIGARIEAGEMAIDDAPAFASVIHLLAVNKELCEWNAQHPATG